VSVIPELLITVVIDNEREKSSVIAAAVNDIGKASYLVTVSGKDSLDIDEALLFYGLQLIFNFFWTIVFFGFGKYFAAFLVLAALWLLIFHTIRLFDPISKKAAYLMVPYLIWVTFAGYLNLGVWWLNR
jgi:tryptophan-rich sensory protein